MKSSEITECLLIRFFFIIFLFYSVWTFFFSFPFPSYFILFYFFPWYDGLWWPSRTISSFIQVHWKAKKICAKVGHKESFDGLAVGGPDVIYTVSMGPTRNEQFFFLPVLYIYLSQFFFFFDFSTKKCEIYFPQMKFINIKWILSWWVIFRKFYENQYNWMRFLDWYSHNWNEIFITVNYKHSIGLIYLIIIQSINTFFLWKLNLMVFIVPNTKVMYL